MATEANYTWVIKAGDQETRQFQFFGPNNPDGSQGAPIDKSGSTFRAEFRFKKGESDTAEAIASTLVNTNTVTVTLTATQTRALSLLGRRFFWDLEETVGGIPTTVVGGSAVIQQDVTR